MTRLFICDATPPSFLAPGPEDEIWSHAHFASMVRARSRRRLWRAYASVTMVLPHLGLRPRPLLIMVVLKCLSRGEVSIVDSQQMRLKVDAGRLLRQFGRTSIEALRLPLLLRDIGAELTQLAQQVKPGHARLRRAAPVLYLKTDLWFSTQVGGSVTHMAGVVNHLHRYGRQAPLVFATAPNSLVEDRIPIQTILPSSEFWDYREVPALLFSRGANRQVQQVPGAARAGFVYQRYSLNNYAGVLLARDLALPLVTEYNGSEVWISRHWGQAAAYSALSARIETLNLDAADLVVVVSQVLRDQLLGRGIPGQRILVNPNGVDPDLFSPAIACDDLRSQLGLDGKTVIGFIGTFGPWHGTEQLVEAFARLLVAGAAATAGLRLLMVGQGARHAATLEQARRLGILSQCVFTGEIPQAQASRYLACCDILAAPHMPNRDGSLFFGSPTKLFEYMAMGRPIVASALGQICEVLEHGRSAWLVPPGDAPALADGLAALLRQPALAAELGTNARSDVLARHTWRHHTQAIIDSLERLHP